MRILRIPFYVFPSRILMAWQVFEWKTCHEFLEKVARRRGRLCKGGEPDINCVAKLILNDWQRGNIPYFVPPPGHDTSEYDLLKQVSQGKIILIIIIAIIIIIANTFPAIKDYCITGRANPISCAVVKFLSKIKGNF